MPVDAVVAPTSAARRSVMINRIRQEVAARKSSLDPVPLERVLDAMRGLEREAFVPKMRRRGVYLPVSLGIGHGQTISDAYVVALMIVAAQVGSDAKVLDVGTGSGYQAALLARLAGRVTSIEIVPALARQAARRLRRLGYPNVVVREGDGRLGDESAAPFDAIIVAAGGTSVPPALLKQLGPGGRMVIPIGPTQLEEQLLVITRERDGHQSTCTLGPAAFVPLTGKSDGSARPASSGSAWPFCFGRPVT